MIEELSKMDDLSWDLLLNADPELSIVKTYIFESRVYVYRAQSNGEILGVLAIKRQKRP